MSEEETALRDETAEPEFKTFKPKEEGLSGWEVKPNDVKAEEVEVAFGEEFEYIEVEEEENKMEEEKKEEIKEEKEVKEETQEEKKERYIDILVGIGFLKGKEKGDGKERYYYKINDDSAVGRTFDSRTPLGKFWCKQNGEFLKDCKDLEIVKRFYAIRSGQEKMPERPKEIARREPATGTAIIPRAGKMVIPALNKTISELGLQEDVDYFTRGGKLVFAKEGELKLAAASKHRVHIETVEIEAEPDKYLPMQLYVRLKGWAEDEEGEVIWETEESNNWSYLNERLRFITKKIRDGRWKKDTDYMVEYNEDGTINKLSPTVATMFELEEFMQDKQKYALRTIIGETKRRIWGEWLGITQSDRRELQFEKEEFDRIQKERVNSEVKAVQEG